MTTEQHRERALNHLAASAAVISTLPDLHRAYHEARDAGHRPSRADVAARRTHEADDLIKSGQKFAEIHALLEQGEQLRRIADGIEELLGYFQGASGRISA